VEEKCTVVVNFNNETDKDAKGIFILSEAADGESAVEKTSSFVTWDADNSKYIVDSTAEGYGDAVKDVAGMLAQFTVSAGAKAYWLADSSVEAGVTKVVDADTAANGIEGMSAAAITAGDYQLVVVSKGVQGTNLTEGYTVYSATVAD